MKRTNVKNERLAALFLLGCMLFNFPFLAIFNVPRLVLGIPALYVYLFGAWAAVIGVAAVVADRADGA